MNKPKSYSKSEAAKILIETHGLGTLVARNLLAGLDRINADDLNGIIERVEQARNKKRSGTVTQSVHKSTRTSHMSEELKKGLKGNRVFFEAAKEHVITCRVK